MIATSVSHSLSGLSQAISCLSNQQYSAPCENLGGASVGEHTRHILEMLQCLVSGYTIGTINYDKRARKHELQTDVFTANRLISELVSSIELDDKALVLHHNVRGENCQIPTNYFRELLYNFEHCIHHQALIKVGLREFPNADVPPDFGVAPSTIEFRAQCAR